MQFCVVIATIMALAAWLHDPVSIMSTWVSGVSAVVGLVFLTLYYGQKYGFKKRERL